MFLVTPLEFVSVGYKEEIELTFPHLRNCRKKKMFLKLFFVLLLSATLMDIVLGAPRALRDEQDLEKNIVEFLSQDEEFLTALKTSALLVDRPLLVRNRRQSEVNGMDIDSIDNDTVEEKEGFFDRAAKFVVDLLQRFLKWINTSDTR